MKRILLGIIIGLSLVGAASSWIATQRYFEIQKSGFEEKSFCNISEYVNCDAAFASADAKLGNIPVAGLGFFYYLGMAGLAWWVFAKKPLESSTASFGWLASLGSVGFAVYKAYIAFFVLNVLCLVCLSIYIVNLLIFLAWHGFLKIGVRNWGALSFKPKFYPLAGGALILLGIGWVVTAGIQAKILNKPDLGVAIREIVQFHFRQSQYQFEVSPDTPVWGNPAAKVTVVEFSDFQCPYCRVAAFQLKPVLTEFKNKIRFYFYHYPLDPKCNEKIPEGMHDKACDAAAASLCAAQKGDFWNFHDDIFRDQKNLSLEMLAGLAKKRGWDEAEFQKCLQAPETLEKVKANIADGEKIYISGTPTLLVNNRRVKYWMEPDILRAILKEEIQRAP